MKNGTWCRLVGIQDYSISVEISWRELLSEHSNVDKCVTSLHDHNVFGWLTILLRKCGNSFHEHNVCGWLTILVDNCGNFLQEHDDACGWLTVLSKFVDMISVETPCWLNIQSWRSVENSYVTTTSVVDWLHDHNVCGWMMWLIDYMSTTFVDDWFF